ncbi:MAG: response regulator [Verrucomicrobiota bacterium]
MPKTRLLIVDDDAIHRLLVSKCLADQSDLEVITSDCGHDVLARLNRGEKFDVLFVDWNMPEMSGYELLCTVRANAQFNNIRIMMLTAKNDMEDVRQALGAGAREYLMKPFTKEMLINKLALLLLD